MFDYAGYSLAGGEILGLTCGIVGVVLIAIGLFLIRKMGYIFATESYQKSHCGGGLVVAGSMGVLIAIIVAWASISYNVTESRQMAKVAKAYPRHAIVSVNGDQVTFISPTRHYVCTSTLAEADNGEIALYKTLCETVEKR